MSTVKKAFAPLVAFLEENANKKVSSVLEDVKAMCSAKSAGGTATASATSEDGRLFIRCSFFNVWMPAAITFEDGTTADLFGAKKGSATGLNPQCKEGANLFAKKQREAKAKTEALLEQIESGELLPGDIGAAKEAIEAERVDRPLFSMPDLTSEDAETAMAVSNEDYAAIYTNYCEVETEVE